MVTFFKPIRLLLISVTPLHNRDVWTFRPLTGAIFSTLNYRDNVCHMEERNKMIY